LFSEKINEELGSKPFAMNAKILQSAGVSMDDVLAKATKWTATEIEKRSRALAKLGFEKIWKI
jgi:Protein of unknown function (DUF1524)